MPPKSKDLAELLEAELSRREEELHEDIYRNRDYCDGIRFEVRRLQEWLASQKENSDPAP